MKTHWISEISHARRERRHCKSGEWYTYIKRQANRQARRNAQLDINEGLDETLFGADDDATHTEWERNEQAVLMDNYQNVLRIALDFACRSVSYWDEDGWMDSNGYYNRDCCTWYDADGRPVAYSEWTGIEVSEQHHDFVWNAFKLFF